MLPPGRAEDDGGRWLALNDLIGGRMLRLDGTAGAGPWPPAVVGLSLG